MPLLAVRPLHEFSVLELLRAQFLGAGIACGHDHDFFGGERMHPTPFDEEGVVAFGDQLAGIVSVGHDIPVAASIVHDDCKAPGLEFAFTHEALLFGGSGVVVAKEIVYHCHLSSAARFHEMPEQEKVLLSCKRTAVHTNLGIEVSDVFFHDVQGFERGLGVGFGLTISSGVAVLMSRHFCLQKELKRGE